MEDHECICNSSNFEDVVCTESAESESCICKAENVCSCQGCGCEANLSVAQCGCGNWQQCVIETQDSEGEH